MTYPLLQAALPPRLTEERSHFIAGHANIRAWLIERIAVCPDLHSQVPCFSREADLCSTARQSCESTHQQHVVNYLIERQVTTTLQLALDFCQVHWFLRAHVQISRILRQLQAWSREVLSQALILADLHNVTILRDAKRVAVDRIIKVSHTTLLLHHSFECLQARGCGCLLMKKQLSSKRSSRVAIDWHGAS